MPIKTLVTLLRVVEDQGYPLEQALEIIGLDFNPLRSDHPVPARVPSTCYSKLYRLLMEILQDEAFGLGQEYHAPPGTFRMMCLFIIHCTTLEQALNRCWEFHEYCDQYRSGTKNYRKGPGALRVLPDHNQVLCVFQRGSPVHSKSAFVAQANIQLMMYRFYSWLIGRQLPLQAVHLQAKAPANPDDYSALFGCPVLFDQLACGLVLPSAALAFPVTRNEDDLREFLRQAPYQLVRRDEPGQVRTLSASIEKILSQYANVRLPNAEAVATVLHMSARTMHRRLTAEGTSFQQLKDRFRQTLAIHYIARPELSIDAIAALMGFQDNSAFYRSFKKWTGESPGQYRQQLGKPVQTNA